MNPDAEFDALIRGQRGIAFGQCCLDLDRTPQGVDDAGELHQQPVASRFDDAAAMFGNLGIDHFDPQRLEPTERPFLVGSDQARIAGNIGSEDRSQTAFCARWPLGLHGASPLALILHQPARCAHYANRADHPCLTAAAGARFPTPSRLRPLLDGKSNAGGL